MEGSDVGSAQSTLTAASFKSRVVYQDTQDPSLDNVVITQDPAAGTQAKPQTTVTLTVGRYTGGTTTDAPPP